MKGLQRNYLRQRLDQTVGGIDMAKRGKIGSIVRLYGYPGVFEVITGSYSNNGRQTCYVIRPGEVTGGFPALTSSIVEIDRQAVPLLSLPIVPPAEDWPYTWTEVLPSDEERALPLCQAIANDRRFYVREPAPREVK